MTFQRAPFAQYSGNSTPWNWKRDHARCEKKRRVINSFVQLSFEEIFTAANLPINVN